MQCISLDWTVPSCQITNSKCIKLMTVIVAAVIEWVGPILDKTFYETWAKKSHTWSDSHDPYDSFISTNISQCCGIISPVKKKKVLCGIDIFFWRDSVLLIGLTNQIPKLCLWIIGNSFGLITEEDKGFVFAMKDSMLHILLF